MQLGWFIVSYIISPYSTIAVLYILDGLASKKLERPKKFSLVYNPPEKKYNGIEQ
jgi:hypothetical protein